LNNNVPSAVVRDWILSEFHLHCLNARYAEAEGRSKLLSRYQSVPFAKELVYILTGGLPVLHVAERVWSALKSPPLDVPIVVEPACITVSGGFHAVYAEEKGGLPWQSQERPVRLVVEVEGLE